MGDISHKVAVFLGVHAPWTGPHLTPGGQRGSEAQQAQDIPPQEEGPGLGEAGQPTWTLGLPDQICHIKGGGYLQELGAYGRVRPGDLGEPFNHLQLHTPCLSEVVMTPVLSTSP